MSEEVGDKRYRRRLRREKLLGPEKKIISITTELVVLECGHQIQNPQINLDTKNKFMPTEYRCIQCLEHERARVRGLFNIQ